MTSAFDTLNRSGFAMLAEAAITARGGSDSMYANDPAKLRACNAWVDHARPIIQAMFAVEDAAGPLTSAWLKAGEGRRFNEPLRWQQRDYDYARADIEAARKALFDTLDGIRDNFIADERCGIGNTDAETEAADEFNDWLDAETITVDAAVKLVADEQDAAYVARRAA